MRRAGFALTLSLLAAAPAPAQEAEWTWSCRFAVEVDGTPSPGSAVFEKRGSADILGMLPGGTWFLVEPPKRVFELPDGVVERKGEQKAVLHEEPEGGGLPLTLTPSGLTFDVSDRWLRIIPAPVLLGETTAEAFLALCPEFQRREESYEPEAESVRKIASTDRPVTVEIYFGSWCPHCQKVLPRLFKSLRLADNQKLQVRLIGLPRKFGQEPAVREKKIRGVPTIIVTDPDGGGELGRFSGTEKTPVEETLAELVGG